MGVVNTIEAWGILDIKVTFWPILIWCVIRSTLIDMKSKILNLLSGIVNEGLTSSSYFLSNLSIPSIGWLTTMVIGAGIVKVWIGKGMM
jgi:hypothetical protein